MCSCSKTFQLLVSTLNLLSRNNYFFNLRLVILMVYLPVVCIPWRSPHRSSQIPVGLVGLPRAEGHWRVGPAGSSAWWVWPESHTTSDWQCQTRYWAVPLPPTSRGYKCACVQVYLKLVKQKRERDLWIFLTSFHSLMIYL